jgi:hypothetical protein
VRIFNRLGLYAALVLGIGGLALAGIAGAYGGATVRQGVYDTDPPETTIKSGPKARTEKAKATFKLKSSEPGSSFECKLDRDQYESCEPTEKLKRLDEGKHKFKARATDGAGNTDPSPAGYRWKIVD